MRVFRLGLLVAAATAFVPGVVAGVAAGAAVLGLAGVAISTIIGAERARSIAGTTFVFALGVHLAVPVVHSVALRAAAEPVVWVLVCVFLAAWLLPPLLDLASRLKPAEVKEVRVKPPKPRRRAPVTSGSLVQQAIEIADATGVSEGNGDDFGLLGRRR
jgi:hypothetical protein